MKKKIVVLNRVSTNMQDFESQNNAINKYINENSILVDEWIVEEGVSGYSNKLYDRVAIRKIEEMALTGQLNTLIIFNLDRIGRTTEANQFINKMTFSNVKVISVTEGLINGGKDTDELVNLFKFWSAQQESKKISIRSKNGKEATNKKGLFCGGRVNFGYRVDKQRMYIVEEEAEIVRLIFDLYIRNGKNETVRYLQENKITKRGRKFSQHMVHDILKDTIYIGLKRYNHYTRISNDPTNKKRRFNKDTMKYQEYKEELRIISDDVFFRVQELIEKRRSSKGKIRYTNRTSALFEGLLYHQCGDGEVRKLHLDNKKDKYGNIIYSYRCSHCKRNFYKNVRKTYGSKTYNKFLEESILELMKNMSINELEDELKSKQIEEQNHLLIAIKQLDKNMNKKQQAIKGLEKELINIFSGDSNLDKSIIMEMLVNTKEEFKNLKTQLDEYNRRLNEFSINNNINKELIDKYKKFNNTYEIADGNQKKLLLQSVVEKITFYGDEIKITLFLE
ncbi:recombinase family protein [Clostridium perfringens]|nr:recombinase family protein [Clostridium perfringens]MDM0964123.1 recombinase family protein [Clostridium perfringens]